MLCEGLPDLARRRLVAALGAAAALIALAVLWIARSTVDRPVYVSELGADTEPTAGWFRFALLLIAGGALAVAWSSRGLRPAARALAFWSIPTSVALSGSLFFVASQVPCTAGCPPPSGENWLQDAVHTSCAVLAFAAGAFAMVQTAMTPAAGVLCRASLASGIAVGIVALIGGLLSLFRFATNLGAALEFVAATIGLGWFAAFGLLLTRRPRHASGPLRSVVSEHA